MVDGVPRKHEHATSLLLAPNKDAAVGAAAEQRPARQMNRDHGTTMAAQRLHARVLGVGVPRGKNVDAAVCAPT